MLSLYFYPYFVPMGQSGIGRWLRHSKPHFRGSLTGFESLTPRVWLGQPPLAEALEATPYL